MAAKTNKEDELPGWVVPLIVILLFVGLIIFIASMGKVDLGIKTSLPDEFKDDKAEAVERHKKLKELVDQQIALKKRLDRKFRNIYLSVRILFVLAWAGLLFGLYWIELINDLEDMLNYSEASLLAAFTMNFLAFGSLANLQGTLHYIKTRLENWVYGKYVTLQDDIDKNQMELFGTEKEGLKK